MDSSSLRVAIIGSGPSGFYAADVLQKQSSVALEIDMFERLPTPFGLVRGGVAPDHPKIKTVTKAYDRIASNANFRFLGNVTYGKDITLADLKAHYHAIIYTVGAQTDRHMNIPGESLQGSHAATEFVGWYNAHPDYRERQFDLSQSRVAVIGLGNVAMDVVRILAKTPEELSSTDIADHALEALRHSQVTHIYVIGRRGPAQASFTNPEIQELGELLDAEVIVSADDIHIDPLSQAVLDKPDSKEAAKNVAIMRGYHERGATGKRRHIMMRFLVSPLEIIGNNGCVEAIKLVKNELVEDGKGGLKAQATNQFETIPVGLVFRSVGYSGLALPEVPFDAKSGRIPNERGRVLREGAPAYGEYTAGWIKRGPSGVIGDNRPDSKETAEMLLEDANAGRLAAPSGDSAGVDALLAARGVRVVTYADWQKIDRAEQERGAERGAVRRKFSRVDEMLAVLDGEK